MLSPIELSGRELGMIKLMTDFFVEKPELTAKIESYTTAHYALITTYSENFGIPEADSWKTLEELQKKDFPMTQFDLSSSFFLIPP